MSLATGICAVPALDERTYLPTDFRSLTAPKKEQLKA